MRELLRGKERPWLAVDVDQGRLGIKSEVRAFAAKHNAECAHCIHGIKKGEKIMKLRIPSYFERPKSQWASKGQYRKVWWAHEDCKQAELERAISLERED